MAEQPKTAQDNLGRSVSVSDFGKTADTQLRDIVQGMMRGDVKTKSKGGDDDKDNSGQYKKLEKILEKIEDKFTDIFKDSKDFADKISKIYKQVSDNAAKPAGKKTATMKDAKVELDTTEAEKTAEDIGEALQKSMKGVADESGKAMDKVAAKIKFSTDRLMQGVAATITGVTGGLSLMSIFEGTVGESIRFERSMRKTLFQTQGIGGTVVHMQEDLTKVGDTVKYTGKMRHKFLQAFDKNMKKGIKTQKETLKITRTGLGLSTLIGDETGSTAELMHEWAMMAGQTSQQMGALAYQIRDVARMTGVTGEALADIVKSSGQMVKNFRNAGAAGATLSGRIIGMQAAASKFGATDIMATFQSSMTGIKGWQDSTMKSFLAVSAAAGGMGGLDIFDLPGIMRSKGKMKDLIKGMESEFLRVGTTAEEVMSGAFQQRAPHAAAQLNIVLEDIAGAGSGEISALIVSLRDQNKSLAERLSDVGEKFKGNLSTEEARLRKEKELELVMGTQLKVLGNIGKDQGVFEAMSKNLKELDAASLKHMGLTQKQSELMAVGGLEALGGATEQAAAMQSIMESTAGNIEEKMKRAGMSVGEIEEFGLSPKSIKKALAGGRGEFLDFMSKAQKAEQAAAQEANANTDPISKVAFHTKKINEKIGQMVSASSKWFMRIFGQLGVIALLIGLGTAAAFKGVIGPLFATMGMKGPLKALGGMPKSLAGMGKGLKSLATRPVFGKGGMGLGKKLLGKQVGGQFAKGGRAAAGAVRGGIGGALQKVGFKGAGTAVAKLGAGTSRLAIAAGGATRALGPALSALNTIPGLGTAIVASLGGVIGAFSAGAVAADIYNVTQKQLTFNQKYAAQEAGFLTGALDMLTFGIFSKWVGPSGTWTKGLAQFFAALGPIRYVIAPITIGIRVLLIAFQVLWGIIKGIAVFITEVFKGIWSMVKIALSPFIELGEFIMSIGSSIASTLGIASEGESVLSKIGDVTEWVVGAFRLLGKTIGWVFKLVGWVVKIALTPFMWALKGIAAVIGGVIKGVILFTKAILKPFQAVWTSIKGIFSSIIEPFISIWDSIKEVFGAITSLFSSGEKSGGMFMAVMDGIAWVFGFLGKIVGWVLKVVLWPLVTVFKLIGFAIKIILTPIMVLAKFISNIAKIIKGELKFSELFKGIGDILLKIPKMIWGVIKKIPGMIWSAIKGIGKMILKGLMYAVMGIFMLIVGIPALIAVGIYKLMGMLWSGIKAVGGFIIGLPGMILNGIMKIGGYILKLPGMLLDGLISLPGKIMDGFISVFVDLPVYLWEGFKEGLGKVWDWIKSWIPGAEGFTESAEESAARIAESGNSFVQGGGRTAGGIKDMFTGGEEGGIGGRWEGAKKAIGGGIEMAKSAGLAMIGKGWLWNEGGPVTKTGLAMLHAGEMVVPSDVPIANAAPGLSPTLMNTLTGSSLVGKDKIAGAVSKGAGKAGEFAAKAKDKLGPALKATQDKLGQLASTAKDKLGPALKSAKDKIGPLVNAAKDKLGPALKTLGGKLPGVGKSILGLGLKMAKMPFKMVSGFAKMPFKSVGWAIKATSNTMKALPAMGKNISTAFKAVKSGNILGAAKSLLNIPKTLAKSISPQWVKNVFGKVSNAIKGTANIATKVGSKLYKMIPPGVQKNIGKIGGALKHSFKSLRAGEFAKAGKILKTIPGHMMKMVPPSVQKSIGEFAAKAKDKLGPALKTVQGRVGEFAAKAKDKLGPALKTVQGRVGEFAAKAKDKLGPALKTAQGKMGEFAAKAKDKLGPALKTAQGKLGEFAAKAKDKFGPALKTAQGKLGEFAAKAKDKFGPALKTAQGKMGEFAAKAKDKFGPALKTAQGKMGEFAAKAKDKFGPALKTAQGKMGEFAAKAKDKFGPALKTAQGKMGEFAAKAKDKLGPALKTAQGKLGEFAAKAKDKLGPALKTAQGRIGEFAAKAKDKLGPALKGLSKSAGEGAGKFSKVTNALKGMGKNALESGSKLTKAAGPALQKLATKAGPAIAKAGGTIVKGAGTVAKAAGGAVARGMGKAAGAIAGKAAGPFALALGGAFGAAEAEALGMTKGEGAILGALTGGAGTGSMFSGMLGVEKDSAADKAMGVAGAAATGAMTGAALTAWLGPGAGIGAAIGGAIGAGAEVYKIFKGPIDNFVGGTLDAMGPLGDGVRAVGGVISGAAGAVGGAIGDVAGGIWEGGKALLSGDIVGAVGGLASGLWNAGGSLLGGVGDMVGAVGKGALAMGKGMLDGAMNIGGAALDAAGAVGGGLMDAAGSIGSAAMDAGSKLLEGDVLGAAGSVISGAAGAVGDVAGGIVSGIGSVASALWPFQEGTPKVAAGGLAMLHPGEMVVPEGVDMARGARGGVEGALGGMWDSIGGLLGGVTGSVVGGLSDSVGSLVGGITGAGSKLMEGNVLGAAGSLIGGGVGAVGGMMGALNPFSWFGGGEEEAAPAEATGGVWDSLFGGGGGEEKPKEQTWQEKLLEIQTSILTINTDILGVLSGGEITGGETDVIKAAEDAIGAGETDMIKAAEDALGAGGVLGGSAVGGVLGGGGGSTADMIKAAEEQAAYNRRTGAARTGGGDPGSAAERAAAIGAVGAKKGGGFLDMLMAPGKAMGGLVGGGLGAMGSAASALNPFSWFGGGKEEAAPAGEITDWFGSGAVGSGVGSAVGVGVGSAVGSGVGGAFGGLIGGGLGAMGSAVSALNPFSWFGGGKEEAAPAGGITDFSQIAGGAFGGAAGGVLGGSAVGGVLGGGDWMSSLFGPDASAVMPTADIHDRVQRDVTTARSSTSVGGKDLSSISSATDAQCATLIEIRDHLKTLVAGASEEDTSSGHQTGEPGSTESMIMPKSAPQYNKWQFGQHGQIGGKQVANDGQ